MEDLFKNVVSGLESPATYLFEVTPSDTVDLPVASRALNVAQAGSVRVTTLDGSVGAIHVGAGMAFPLRVKRIWATGTTATGIVVMS
ncbi:MAG: hypothetical protein HLUCCA08_00365 [Rhodobacteraceae bacterium HLUCCA08]|nr:MAG: hypothetical protein HLUCCA08_00365 [Rhodobacteraceae bacterium HLUCCA08]